MLDKEHKRSEHALRQAKQHNVHTFLSDWDETLANRDYLNTAPAAVSLISEISTHQNNFCITSGRGVSLRVDTDHLFRKEAKRRNAAISLFISGGNGSQLDHVIFHKNGYPSVDTLHQTGINDDDVDCVLQAYSKIPLNNPDSGSAAFFKNVISKIIRNKQSYLLPQQWLDLNKKHQGKLLIEPAKISIVLPHNIHQQRDYVNKLRGMLTSSSLTISHGNRPFADISKIPTYEKKAASARILLHYLGLQNDEVAFFGDQPSTIDKELLHIGPWSFTNNQKFLETKNPIDAPPYILKPTRPTTKSIHRALRFLAF